MAEYIDRKALLSSICKKFCDRTICKYENEFDRRKQNEMEAK